MTTKKLAERSCGTCYECHTPVGVHPMHHGKPFKCLYALGDLPAKYGDPQYSGAYFYHEVLEGSEMVICRKVPHSDEKTDEIVDEIRRVYHRGWGVPLVVINDRTGTTLIYEHHVPGVKAADVKYPPPKPRRKKRSRKARKKGKK